MKITTFLAFSIGAISLSCSIKSDNGNMFSFNPKEGKGPIQNKEISMNIDEIEVSQSIRAEIIKSSDEKVVIFAPSDIIDDVLADNNNEKLHVHFKPNLNISTKNVSVKVFVKDFSRIEANSSADIVVKDTFTQDKTTVDVSSSGNISGNLEANDLKISVNSSGDFSGKVWAVNLLLDASSSGDISVEGKTKNVKATANSSGDISAQNLISENAELEASSSGDVNVSVSHSAKADASSSGEITVFRKGNPQVESQKSSGGEVYLK